MGLNFGDVALNLAAGAIDKDEKYRQDALEQRYKELADNKEPLTFNVSSAGFQFSVEPP